MSFRCEGCKNTAHKPRIITTKTRMHEHTEVRYDERNDRVVDVVMGVGTQIVEQKKLCNNCVSA